MEKLGHTEEGRALYLRPDGTPKRLGETVDLSNRMPRAVEKALQAEGHATERSYQSYAFAGVHGIALWDGVPEGGADPQRDGYAAGV